MYWLNFLFGIVLKTFFSKYWLSGHFSVASKSKHALKQLLTLLLIAVPILLILVILAYFYLSAQIESVLSTIVILLMNINNMCILVLQLAYGLAFLPVVTWKQTDTGAILYEHLLIAQDCYNEYRDARLEYLQEVSKCRDLVSSFRTSENSAFLDILLQEIPQNDLDG